MLADETVDNTKMRKKEITSARRTIRLRQWYKPIPYCQL